MNEFALPPGFPPRSPSDADATENRRNAAVNSLYAAFSQYPKTAFERCADALDLPTEQLRAAWGKSLRAYDTKELGHFASHSFCGCDLDSSPEKIKEQESNNLKFWLPRLLDELCHGRSAGFVTEDWFLVKQLTAAAWLDWPDDEVAAVREWCEACIECRMAGCLDQGLWDPLEFAVSLGLDLTPALSRSLDSLHPHAIKGIHDVILRFAPEVIRREALEQDDRPSTQAKRNLARWMLHRTTITQLERSFFHYAEAAPEIAALASEALDWIDIINRSYRSLSKEWPAWL